MDEDDNGRLQALRGYEVLDTPSESDFDELAELARTLCMAPVALVSLVDAHRQWFKAELGLGVRETPIAQSVCARVMHEPGPLQIPDLRVDPRSRDNTLVTGPPYLRFYAGAPLRTTDGVVLGMLCVLDYEPRTLTDSQLHALGVLSRQVVAQLEMRKRAALLARHAKDLAAALEATGSAQAEVRRAEEEHKFVVDHVLAGLVVHAADGGLLFANDMACESLGLSREQLAGKAPTDPAWRFLRDDGSTMPMEEYPVVRVLRTRQDVRNLVVGVVRAAGTAPLWALVHAFARLGANGLPDRVVVSFADITILKHLEEQLRLADRRKDEFLATLAHELRNPLAPIRNAAEVLGTGRASAPQAQWCQQVIARQASHMSLLLDDLLDVSRISQGKLQLRPQEVSCQEVVEAAQEVALPLIERKRHQLVVELPAHAVKLHVDKVRISQVLANLLTNAAKYTDAGGRLEIGARLEEGSPVFWVEDNGVGLTAAEIEQVFDLFGQAGSSEGRSEGGLGIGLALARGIVHLHGGSLRAASAGRGSGSRFTVLLPSSALVQPSAPQGGEAAMTDESSAGPPQRILLVDDNVDAAETLAFLLRARGHDVHVAHSGATAVGRLCAEAFDVAFVDISMPGMDGYEVARQVQTCRADAMPRLIALTGYDQPAARRKSSASGFDAHLTKPVELQTLFELMQAAPRGDAPPGVP